MNTINTTLNRQEDKASQKGVGNQEGTYSKVYDEALEEWMMARFVRNTTKAQASYLALMSFRGIGTSFKGRRVAVVGGL